MAQPQANVSLTAPGFAGVNTQDSPLDMDISFASVANNCVIDRFGRIGSRRGFDYVTSNPVVLEDGSGVSQPIVAIDEFITAQGDTWLLCSGNKKLWIQQTTNPFELVELTLPAGYVITDDNWQFISFNDLCYIVQRGHKPLIFDPVAPTAVREWAEYPTAGTNYPNTGHAAFGRLWLTAFDDSSTVVFWSGLLNGENWSTLGWGSLQTEEYWPAGFDEMTALAGHNNFMVLFGKRNILLYNTTSDVVNTLQLTDTIEGLGCIARDSVVPTGTDIMFIDATGVRSLNRTIQEKSVPIGDISMNVRIDFQDALREEPEDDIKGVFHVEDSFYACFLPSNPLTYVFDTWNPLPTGAARVTLWSNIRPRCATRTIERTTYFGGLGGVYNYEGAQDIFLDTDNAYVETVESIPMQYFTQPLDFGSPAKVIFPKQVDVTLFGGLEGDLTISWAYDYSENFATKVLPLQKLGNSAFWGEDYEWSDPENEPLNVGKFGEWTAALNNLNQLRYNIWGSGRNVKIGFSTDILGSPVSIQELNVQALQGRIL